MKCTRIALEKLRNEEWFQFLTEFCTITKQYDPIKMDIEVLFDQMQQHYADADEALEQIKKSAITDDLQEADKLRDDLYRGLRDAVKATLLHFNPEKKEAAKRLKIVFDHFGDIVTMGYDQQTATLYNFIQQMRGLSAPDVELLGLADWVNELEIDNRNFDNLMQKRYTEQAGKTDIRMREVRTQADSCFRATLDRLDALVLVNGAPKYEAYIRDLNTRTERYLIIIAQRKGRNKVE